MKCWSAILAAFVFCGLTYCQESAQPSSAQQSSAGDAGQVLSSDLIAWSFMQQPQQPEPQHQQPAPEPAPETQPAPNPTQAQPGEPRTPPSTEESQAPAAQTFTGTISKEAESYVLKISDTTSYKLDSDQQVQPYEGRRVQVTGTLDRTLNLIHVDKVEPLT